MVNNVKNLVIVVFKRPLKYTNFSSFSGTSIIVGAVADVLSDHLTEYVSIAEVWGECLLKWDCSKLLTHIQYSSYGMYC